MAKTQSQGFEGRDFATKRAVEEPDVEALEALAREDRAFNEQMLPRVSRTFALSILSLPTSLREAVCLAYLLCRIVDSIEDAASLPPERRQALFDDFDALLEDDTLDPAPFERAFAGPVALTEAERELCRRAGATFRRFRALPEQQRAAIRPSVREMSRGMQLYSARADAAGALRLRDIEDLERYCYFVAGTVGELLTALFEQTVPSLDPERLAALRARAVPFGLGLQIVNIVKDVAEDAERGVCYLPTEVLARHGASIERLLDPEERQKGLSALAEVTALARKNLEAAAQYTLLWPEREAADVRAFCAVPLALAWATLTEVERGADTLIKGREPKIDRALAAEILAGARRAADANASLARLFAKASEGQKERAKTLSASSGPLLRARRPPTPPVPRFSRSERTPINPGRSQTEEMRR